MDTIIAFALGEANRGKELMVFDWLKAAEIIKEKRPLVASAGLRGDWEWTGGDIYRDGKPIPKDEMYTFLASIWAVPELNIDNEETIILSITLPCYKMESETDGWGK